MAIKIQLSSQHYLLDGVVYSSATNAGDSPLATMAAIADGDVARLELARKYSLTLPGTPGVIVGTTADNGVPKFQVQFDGVEGVQVVAGKFINRIE